MDHHLKEKSLKLLADPNKLKGYKIYKPFDKKGCVNIAKPCYDYVLMSRDARQNIFSRSDPCTPISIIFKSIKIIFVEIFKILSFRFLKGLYLIIKIIHKLNITTILIMA